MDPDGDASKQKSRRVVKQELPPTQAKAREWFLLGSRAYRVHDYTTAVRHFSKAILLHNSQATFFAARAKAYRELADFKSALVDYRVAARLDPDNEAYTKPLSVLIDMQGHLHLDARSYEAAKHCFTDAIKHDKVVVHYWLHRAVANVYLEEWRLALADVDRALALDARNADAHVLRAKLYWKLGMLPQGNADMTAAVALQPGHPEVVEFEEARWSIAESAYQRAASLMLLKDSAGAILELHRALELAPDDVKYRVLRAAAYRQEGNYADSLRDIETAARVFRHQLKEDTATEAKDDGKGPSMEQLDNVEHPEISRQRNLTLNAVAILQHQRGNYGHALTLYNKVIQSETSMAQLHDRNVDSRFLMNRGDTYLKLDQLQQALADFHRAYDSDPKNTAVRTRLAVVHDTFGVRLFNDGLVAQAEVEFSTAIDYNGAVAVFHVHRGNAAMYLQKMDLAYRDYTRALELDPHNLQAASRLASFNRAPGLSRALKTDTRRTLARRVRSTALPAPPSQRLVGGRKPGRTGNIWEDARKLELMRTNTQAGWTLQRQHHHHRRHHTHAATRGFVTSSASVVSAGRTTTSRRSGRRRPATTGGVTTTPANLLGGGGGGGARPRLAPFVGLTTGQLVDPQVALTPSSWLDPQLDSPGGGGGGGGGGVGAGGADWIPHASSPPQRRRGSDYGGGGGGGSVLGGGGGAGAGAGGGGGLGRRTGRGSVDSCGRDPVTGFPPIGHRRPSVAVDSVTGVGVGGGVRGGGGGGGSRGGGGGGGTWDLQRLRLMSRDANSRQGMQSPVVELTTQWKELSMDEIRAEVLPRRPEAQRLQSVLDVDTDYRTMYFEKAVAYVKKTTEGEDSKKKKKMMKKKKQQQLQLQAKRNQPQASKPKMRSQRGGARRTR